MSDASVGSRFLTAKRLYSKAQGRVSAPWVVGLKRESSKWIKLQSPVLSSFHWQNGYGAFSVSPSHVDDLKRYIANQMEHHKTETFQDEFRRLCRKYGIEIDERYVWD